MSIQILDKQVASVDVSAFWGANLDLPVLNQSFDGFQFALEGWALSRQTPIRLIEVRYAGAPLFSAELSVLRPDVAAAFPLAENALTSGFTLRIEALLLPEKFELELGMYLDDDTWVHLADVSGQRSAFVPMIQSPFQPLLVLGYRRSGTTLLMRSLSVHASIAIYPEYPYEAQVISYWLHVFRILSADADYLRSSHPDEFVKDSFFVGHNTLFHDRFSSIAASWRYTHYLPDLAAFCAKNIEGMYQLVAAAQNRPQAGYYAEKAFSPNIFLMQSTLYPQSRAILLVRDFRDMLCSILSFNEKRGYDGFGVTHEKSLTDYIRYTLRPIFMNYLAILREHPGQVLLVRYEDLILKPRETLTQILQGLELSAEDAILDEVLNASLQDTDDLIFHRTTSGVMESIGRWKSDLSLELQADFQTYMGDLLLAFGYEL